MFVASQDGETVEFVPIRAMGPKHAPQGNMYIFLAILVHWSMYL